MQELRLKSGHADLAEEYESSVSICVKMAILAATLKQNQVMRIVRRGTSKGKVGGGRYSKLLPRDCTLSIVSSESLSIALSSRPIS